MRLLTVICVDTTPASDAAWYFQRAIELAQGEGYSEGGLPTAFWPVGHPAMLGALFTLFGAKVIVGQIANLAFGCASFAGVYHLARRLTEDEAVARTAVLALTIYPNHVAYTNLLLTEVVYSSLLLWAFILATGRPRPWYWIASGCLFGLAALTKAQTLAFPGFLFVFLFLLNMLWTGRMKATEWIRLNISRIVVINLTMLVVVAPWTW